MNYINNHSSSEARGTRIKFISEQLLSLSREEFCRNCNLTAQSLKGWELAWGGGLSQQGAVKIAKRAKELNIYCTDFWLMHGIGKPATHITKDLELEEGDERHIAKELLLFREQKNTLDTLITDDSMIPFLYPGDYVAGIRVNHIENAIGKECIVVTDNDEVFVRILRHGTESGRDDLICINEHALIKKKIQNIVIKFVAPVVWIRRVVRERG
jgi:hypothetical protein